MRIGELANETGVSTKTIRYYEDIGVLPRAERAPNGYRTYSEKAADRIRFIRDAQATGLTLTEITSVLELREQGASTCQHVTHLLGTHLSELDIHIAALQETRKQLAALTDRARGLDPANCTDPNRCQTITSGIDPPDKVPDRTHPAPYAHRH